MSPINRLPEPDAVHRQIEALYAQESRRVYATLVRLLGNFELAEEGLHEAFRVALERWPRDGIPDHPRAWLVSTGRFKAIDGQRKLSRWMRLDDAGELADESLTNDDMDGVEDDQLRLIFTCCHPALAPEARIALTLREVCGLTTEQIAKAFLLPTPTLAQRIVRAKAKIRDAGIPYQVPGRAELPERLHTVLRVVYLVFNEGYVASSGTTLGRHDLSTEAIRLGRLLMTLLPEPEVQGLLALMLLHESRRAARTDAEGDIVTLDVQDRSQWDQQAIKEGLAHVQSALRSRRFGPYTLQAAIAAVHAEAPCADATDWVQIVGLYDVLLRVEPSPVVELNRAAAIAMRDGAQAGYALVQNLLKRQDLQHYHLTHSFHADVCRRLGYVEEAQAAYQRALALTRQAPEQRFLQRRLHELAGADERQDNSSN